MHAEKQLSESPIWRMSENDAVTHLQARYNAGTAAMHAPKTVSGPAVAALSHLSQTPTPSTTCTRTHAEKQLRERRNKHVGGKAVTHLRALSVAHISDTHATKTICSPATAVPSHPR